jgi:hypothetical protein
MVHDDSTKEYKRHIRFDVYKGYTFLISSCRLKDVLVTTENAFSFATVIDTSEESSPVGPIRLRMIRQTSFGTLFVTRTKIALDSRQRDEFVWRGEGDIAAFVPVPRQRGEGKLDRDYDNQEVAHIALSICSRIEAPRF